MRNPAPMTSIRRVGREVPLVGTGWPSSCGVGVADADASVVAVGAGVNVGVRLADGVASPSTWVPLLRMVKVWVMATGLPRTSTDVMVTLCFPAPRDLAGV